MGLSVGFGRPAAGRRHGWPHYSNPWTDTPCSRTQVHCAPALVSISRQGFLNAPGRVGSPFRRLSRPMRAIFWSDRFSPADLSQMPPVSRADPSHVRPPPREGLRPYSDRRQLRQPVQHTDQIRRRGHCRFHWGFRLLRHRVGSCRNQSRTRLQPGPSDFALPPAAGPTIFVALQQPLGLKLEPVVGALALIVSDQADRP
jgi:hypothetical protein